MHPLREGGWKFTSGWRVEIILNWDAERECRHVYWLGLINRYTLVFSRLLDTKAAPRLWFYGTRGQIIGSGETLKRPKGKISYSKQPPLYRSILTPWTECQREHRSVSNTLNNKRPLPASMSVVRLKAKQKRKAASQKDKHRIINTLTLTPNTSFQRLSHLPLSSQPSQHPQR